MDAARNDRTCRPAVMPGDGIAEEGTPEGPRVLEAAAKRIGGHDADGFGAVGWPDTVPDHVPPWGSPTRSAGSGRAR